MNFALPVLHNDGWDRQIRKPEVPLLPAGACDCAVHVYGPPQASALDAARRYEPPRATVDDLIRLHDTLGISRTVLIQPTSYGADHGVLLDALARGKGRFLATGLIDDDTTDAEMTRLGEAGVRGARFNWLGRTVWDRPRFERAVARLAAHGWIALVHGTADEMLERREMLLNVRVPVVIDHMLHWDLARSHGSGEHIDFVLDLLGRGNFWMKLSNADRISREDAGFNDTQGLTRRFIEAAPDRAIWATDWPHVLYRKPRVPNDAELVELFFRTVPEPSLRQKILVDNPAALFRFAADDRRAEAAPYV
ncbi:MAG: 2-pyrone-4,6-dicarboxylate hydrolase [Betaproteobacteria bacterium]|nr:2-pyrone-4,6-dicarboxylate hydrolase [Betaproteobacteria bacterium]